jgi:NTP pyrophosphatase (non-canonical NTP hydrolase)
LVTEAGELADVIKKHLYYGADLDYTNLIEEAGDLMWYLSILLDELNVSFSEVMEKNIAKLKKRYPDKFSKEHALNRDLEGEREILEKK